MSRLTLRYYCTGVKEEVGCSLVLKSKGNSNTLIIGSDSFVFYIVLDDSVELDEFLELLERKKEKHMLECVLIRNEKRYKGKRKIVWKADNIAVSLGGIRLEFGREAQETLIGILTSIKSRQ